MNGTDRVLANIIRATGGFQVLLGALFWVGFLKQLTTLHMVVGILFVLAIWVLAARALFAGAARPLAAVTILWGALVVGFGMSQAQIMPGPGHWIIRVLHLVVGMVAMGLAQGVGKGLDLARAASPEERQPELAHRGTAQRGRRQP